MDSNPLKKALGEPPRRLSQQEQLDKINDYTLSIGRNDIHWFVHNGKITVGFKD